VAIRKISLVLFVSLWFELGCHTQTQSDHQGSAHDTRGKTEIPSPATSNQFSRNLSMTVLKFGLNNCRSTLRDINRTIDNLTARTQPDYWESVKQRYSTSKARYARLCEDWAKAASSGAAEQASIQQRLAELESMLLETGKRMERSDSEYAQQRSQYELRKRKYFAELQSEQEETESTAQRFYADAKMNIGLSTMDVTLSHVLLTLEAYAREPATPVSEDKIHFTQKEGLSSAEGLEDYVNLVDQHHRDIGSPQEIQYDRLHSLDGLIVTMAFVRNPSLEQTSIQLRIKPSPLGNAEPITLVIPPDQESERLAKALEADVLLQSAQSDGPASTETKVVRCLRENLHLKVPVKVNIHGVEIETTMLLDTGASVTVLSKSVYNRGQARPLAELETMQLKNANGSITCPVDTLRVSTTAYAKSIPIVLTDDSMSLLGMDYLAGHRFTVDLDRECIYIHPNQP